MEEHIDGYVQPNEATLVIYIVHKEVRQDDQRRRVRKMDRGLQLKDSDLKKSNTV
jgi:hypothetical protein